MSDPTAKRLAFSFSIAAAALLLWLVPLRAQGPGRQTAPATPTVEQQPWRDKTLSPDKRADLVLAQMTLDEKMGMVHGAGFSFGRGTGILARSNGGAGFIPGIERLGLPDINMADSAVGVTRGAERSRYSTALPSTLAEAASWDPQLAAEYGKLIGQELRDQGYNMTLGGGVDITREPRNGRNFEYQGEDPILAGTMVGYMAKAVQDQGVIGDIKHYVLNDQETGRTIGNAVLDKRSMRESDLLAFEIGIKIANPGAVMCSYNKVNGDYACENDYTLNEVLKKDWGFKGFVVSDWGGTHSTVKAALAGLDIEMPGSQYFGDSLKTAIQNGQVPAAHLDEMVHRILRTEFASGVFDNPPEEKVVDVFHGLDVAQHVEEEAIVLLKNANSQLPLRAATLKSIAVIGAHADVGVLSGGGSSQVTPPGGNAVPPPPGVPTGIMSGTPVYDPSSPLKAIQAKARGAKVTFNEGTDPSAAAAAAKGADVAIVFATQYMTEGRDAATLALSSNQDALVSAVAGANPHTIVVLETGAAVTMPWLDQVSGVLETWYPGIRGGQAIADVLFGDVGPSGRLPVTFPKSDADLPHPEIAGMNLVPTANRGPVSGLAPGRGGLPPFDINYTEGVKVGYKWFDAENKTPLFPFGFGLSYTTFAYSGLKADAKSVTFTVRNTGRRAGTETAQVYVGLPASTNEPPKRLVAWQRVELAPGASKTVTLELNPLYLAIFNVDKDSWEVVPGDYKIFVGGSSRETPLTTTVTESAAQPSQP
jgi:beta-glucosidase